MKIMEVKVPTFAAYVLSDNSRNQLLTKFPPKYPTVSAHHITIKFGVVADEPIPQPTSNVKVVGYVDSGDGIEALVVSVNGSTDRPDGKTYHITWSFDPSKYQPKSSNELLSKKRYTLIKSIPIAVTPAVL